MDKEDCFDEIDIFSNSSTYEENSEQLDSKFGSNNSNFVDSDVRSRPESMICRASFDSLNVRDSDFIEEIKDIEVSIERFKKVVQSYESFVAFIIITKSCRSDYPDGNYQVQRRYTDFVWLRRRLEDSLQNMLIPPLPEKHSLSKSDRFSISFIDQRRIALNKFLCRLVEHPIFSCQDDLKTFLTLNREEFVNYQSSHQPSGNILTRLASDIQLKSASAPDTRPEIMLTDKFCALYNDVEKFGSLMTRLDHTAARICTQRTAWSRDLQEMSLAFNQWASCENSTSMQCLQTVCNAYQQMSSAAMESVRYQSQVFRPGVHEYRLYSDSVKAVLKRRDLMENDLIRSREEMSRCQIALTQGSSAGVDHTDSRSISSLLRKKETPEEKAQRLTNKIEKLNNKSNSLHDKIACANADLRCDFERWSLIRRRDMAGLLKGLAKSEVELHSECVALWSEAIRQIGSVKNDSEEKTDDISL